MPTKKMQAAQVPDFIIESLAEIVGKSLTAGLTPTAQKVYEKNKKLFTGPKIKVALSILNVLAEETAKTNTKLDDTGVNVFIDLFKNLAANNSINLK